MQTGAPRTAGGAPNADIQKRELETKDDAHKTLKAENDRIVKEHQDVNDQLTMLQDSFDTRLNERTNELRTRNGSPQTDRSVIVVAGDRINSEYENRRKKECGLDRPIAHDHGDPSPGSRAPCVGEQPRTRPGSIVAEPAVPGGDAGDAPAVASLLVVVGTPSFRDVRTNTAPGRDGSSIAAANPHANDRGGNHRQRGGRMVGAADCVVSGIVGSVEEYVVSMGVAPRGVASHMRHRARDGPPRAAPPGPPGAW